MTNLNALTTSFSVKVAKYRQCEEMSDLHTNSKDD